MPSTIESIDASQPTIYVRRSAATISDAPLTELREVARIADDRTSDCLRRWLGDCVAHEIARRSAEDGELEEPAAWNLPWHQWNDEQLAASLAASYSWYDLPISFDAEVVLREVHRAIVTACCTRLGELHEAITRAQRGK